MTKAKEHWDIYDQYKMQDVLLSLRMLSEDQKRGIEIFEEIAMSQGPLHKYRRLALMSFLYTMSFNNYTDINCGFITNIDAVRDQGKLLKEEMKSSMMRYHLISKVELLDHIEQYQITKTREHVDELIKIGNECGIYVLE
jgi:hypothetical protein